MKCQMITHSGSSIIVLVNSLWSFDRDRFVLCKMWLLCHPPHVSSQGSSTQGVMNMSALALMEVSHPPALPWERNFTLGSENDLCPDNSACSTLQCSSACQETASSAQAKAAHAENYRKHLLISSFSFFLLLHCTCYSGSQVLAWM